MLRLFTLCAAVLFSTSHLEAARVPTIVFVAGEFEYHSKETLPAFAHRLSSEYKVHTIVLQRPDDPEVQSIPDLEKIQQADLLVIMIRRMVLPEEQLNQFKRYLNSGKPLLGLRTASHSFENWKEFDAQVLGGNYHNHFGNQLKPVITIIPEARDNPILRGVDSFVAAGSLYKNAPLQPDSVPLLVGKIEGQPIQPVAWTHTYHGARIFYSSLGHPDDFKNETFVRLVHNAMDWALHQPLERRAP